jgi:hypothetical protein
VSAKVDVSTFSVVVWCVECTDWRALADDTLGGHDVAVAHELKFHPGCRDAAVNRLKWMKRQAKKSLVSIHRV